MTIAMPLDWNLVRRGVEDAFRSSLHCSVATFWNFSLMSQRMRNPRQKSSSVIGTTTLAPIMRNAIHKYTHGTTMLLKGSTGEGAVRSG